MMTLIAVALVGLCWGSFLNVIGYRLVAGKSLFTWRSHCPSCDRTLAWYDLFPLLSWAALRGRCRSCQAPISFLYPFTEFLTAVVFSALYLHIFPFGMDVLASSFLIERIISFAIYALFFSALIIALRTDLHAMVVFEITTLWMLPFGLLGAFFGFSKITITESIAGMVIGYGALWLVGALFKLITKKDGIGTGDLELVAMIGAFVGPLGVWFSVLIASVSGLILGTPYLYLIGRQRMRRIPFAPFLAMGAMLFFFFEPTLVKWLLVDVLPGV